MAVLSTNNPTLMDLADRQDENGKYRAIVEMLDYGHNIFGHMTFKEGNLTTGNKTTIRTGLPEPTWRALYQGVHPTKSSVVAVTDTTGSLQDYAVIDKALADLGGNPQGYRLTEDRAHLEGMRQEFVRTLFYGSEKVNVNAFTGLTPRYSSLNPNVPNAKNVIDAGGTGSGNRSIWFVNWGPDTIYGIVPKGSRAGLHHQDKGQVTVTLPDGSHFEAYRSWYSMSAGLTVADWRYASRVANIDIGNISHTYTNGAFAHGPDLPDLMFRAWSKLPRGSATRGVIYMDENILMHLQAQLAARIQSSTLRVEDAGGVAEMKYLNMMIRTVEALNVDETRVTA